MPTTPPNPNDRVSVGILKAELAHLREFLDYRLTTLGGKMADVNAKVEEACDKLDDLETKVHINCTAISLQDQRLTRLEKFQEKALETIVRWAGVGVGIAVTVIVIAAGLTKWAGLW